jgi:hypothetical protein
MNPTRIWFLAAIASMVSAASVAQEHVKLLDNSPLYDAEVLFPSALRGTQGEVADLRINFLTNSSGEVSKPTLELTVNGQAASSGGYCEPVCITYGNPKKTFVLEFGNEIATNNTLKMNVQLWKDGAQNYAAQSTGVLNFSAAKVANE